VAIDRSSPLSAPLWRWRALEWALLAMVIAVLALLFLRQMRVVQAQAELATIQSTLGALRTALVVDHLRQSIANANSAAAPGVTNPFELLQRRPTNYLGEMTAAHARDAAPGNWVFDRDCVCVGYLPLHDQWFEAADGGTLAWFRITGAPGPLQITAKQRYVWQGNLLD